MSMRLRTALLCALASTLLATSATAVETALQQAVAADYPHLQSLFEHLHAHPELSLQEVETAKRLAAELKPLGFTVTTGVAMNQRIARSMMPAAWPAATAETIEPRGAATCPIGSCFTSATSTPSARMAAPMRKPQVKMNQASS